AAPVRAEDTPSCRWTVRRAGHHQALARHAVADGGHVPPWQGIRGPVPEHAVAVAPVDLDGLAGGKRPVHGLQAALQFLGARIAEPPEEGLWSLRAARRTALQYGLTAETEGRPQEQQHQREVPPSPRTALRGLPLYASTSSSIAPMIPAF